MHLKRIVAAWVGRGAFMAGLAVAFTLVCQIAFTQPASAQAVPLVELVDGSGVSYRDISLDYTRSLGDGKIHPELVSLSASLKHDPVLIYQYVRDTIETLPLYGLRKGALGALIDRKGTGLDQAALMVELLRAADAAAGKKFAPQYRYMRAGISQTDMVGLYGLSDQKDMCRLLKAGGFSFSIVSGTSRRNNCEDLSAGQYDAVELWHWVVEAAVGGKRVAFDPSLKKQVHTSGVDLGSYMSFDRPALERAAAYTVGTTGGVSYISGDRQAAIEGRLQAFASTLATRLKRPDAYDKALVDVVGGVEIAESKDQAVIPARFPAFKSLPHYKLGWRITKEIPDQARTRVVIRYNGSSFTAYLDDLYGRRLWFRKNGTMMELVVGRRTVWQVAYRDGNDIHVKLVYPQHAPDHARNLSASFNPPFTAGVGTTAALIISTGDTGLGLVGRYMDDSYQARGEDTGKPLVGDTSVVEAQLAVGANFLAQQSQLRLLSDGVTGARTVVRGVLGMVAGKEGEGGTVHMDMRSQVAVTMPGGRDADRLAAYETYTAALSTIEGAALKRQFVKVGTKISKPFATTANKVIAEADRLYDVPARQMASIKPHLTGYSADELRRLETGASAYNATHRLLLPGNGGYRNGNFTGAAYIVVHDTSGSMGHLLHDGVYARNHSIKGAFFASPGSDGGADQSQQELLATVGFNSSVIPSVSGKAASYTEMVAGSGAFPYALPFSHSFAPGNGVIGGWNHNYTITGKFGDNSMIALGARAPVEAAYVLAALKGAYAYALGCRDTTSACRLKRAKANAVIMDWMHGKILDNVYSLQNGGADTIYAKLADGSYHGPTGTEETTISVPGIYTVTLTNMSGSVMTLKKGDIHSWTWPYGVRLDFTVTKEDGVITKTVVKNNLGRQLTINRKPFAVGVHLLTVFDEQQNGRRIILNAATKDNFFNATASVAVTTSKTSAKPAYRQYAFNDEGNIKSITNNGLTTTYQYDAMGKLTGRSNSARGTVRIYSNSWRSEVVEPGGGSSVSVSDPYGRSRTVIDALGSESREEYDRLGRVVKVFSPTKSKDGKDGQQAYTIMAYNSYHQLTSQTAYSKPTGGKRESRTTSFRYHGADQYRQLYRVTGPDSSVREYHYHTSGNGKGRLKHQSQPAVRIYTASGSSSNKALRTSYSYTSRGLPETVTAPDGTVTRTSYDSKGMPTRVVVDEKGRKITTRYSYSPRGDVTSVTDHRNAVTRYRYNAFRLPTSIEGPEGSSTRYVYEEGVRLQETTFGGLLRSTRTYDEAGRLIAVRDNQGLTTAIAYDDEANIIRITAPNKLVTERHLDRLGRPVRVVRAKGSEEIVEKSAYTADGLLAWVEDGRETRTHYKYDQWNRLVETDYFAGSSELIEGYDLMDRPTRMVTRGGSRIRLFYNALGWVTKRSVASGASYASYSYRHDAMGRTLKVTRTEDRKSSSVSYRYDSLGRVVSETGDHNLGMAYAYNDAAGTYDLTYNGGMMVRYAMDGLGRVTSIKESGTIDIAAYEYDLLSRVKKLTYGNGAVQDYVYDEDTGWLESLTLDGNGNGVLSDTGDVSFRYDRDLLGRITKETLSNPEYAYAPVFEEEETTYSVDRLDRYTKVATGADSKRPLYDTSGNLTSYGDRRYSYDGENRLIEVKKRISGRDMTVGSYKYDALGRRSNKTSEGRDTRYLWGGWVTYGEYTASNSVKRLYVYGPGIDEPLMVKEADGQNRYTRRYIHRDGKSNVIAVSRASGGVEQSFTMDAFGNGTDDVLSAYKFTARRLDGESGLYYYRNRYYHAELGRFMSPDPIGYGDGLNLYTYAYNDPINNRDPLGLARCRFDEKACSTVTSRRSVQGSVWQELDGLARFSEEYAQMQDAYEEQLGEMYDTEMMKVDVFWETTNQIEGLQLFTDLNDVSLLAWAYAVEFRKLGAIKTDHTLLEAALGVGALRAGWQGLKVAVRAALKTQFARTQFRPGTWVNSGAY